MDRKEIIGHPGLKISRLQESGLKYKMKEGKTPLIRRDLLGKMEPGIEDFLKGKKNSFKQLKGTKLNLGGTTWKSVGAQGDITRAQ